VCFVLFIVCLYICVCECPLQNNNHKTKHNNNTTSKQHEHVRGPLRECRSIWSGASGLPYYCAPLVCVSAVIDSLAVWWHNKPKPPVCVSAVLGALACGSQTKPNQKKNLNSIAIADVCCVIFFVCMYICVGECLLQNNIAGVLSSRATFGFPQYCSSTCARSDCTRHTSCVDSKPKKMEKN